MMSPNHYYCHGLLELEAVDSQDWAGIEGYGTDGECYRLKLD